MNLWRRAAALGLCLAAPWAMAQPSAGGDAASTAASAGSVPSSVPSASAQHQPPAPAPPHADVAPTPPPAAPEPRAVGVAVTYREEVAFWLYSDMAERSAAQRAREASAALAGALDLTAEEVARDVPAAQVAFREGVAHVRVRGVLVALLHPQDATAAGFPDLQSYGEHVQAQLMEFVPAQLRRGSLQRTVLHVFLSVFLALLAALALRQLRSAFDRLDEILESRRGALPGLTIFKLPLMSSEAVGGTLALAGVLGRWLAYLATLGVGAAAVLGQFDATRPWLTSAGKDAGRILLNGVQAVGGAVPSLFLAALLVLALQGAFRVLDVLLSGVKSGRLHWSGLTPERVGVARLAARTGLTVGVLPLLVAAVFGRFGTPLETVAVVTAGVLVVAFVPVLASTVTGAVLVWRQGLKPGDWVEVGAHRGEVTSISLLALIMVPDEGGTVTVPTLSLLWHPVRRLPAPLVQLVVTLAKKGSGQEHLDVIKRVVTPVAPDCRVLLTGATADRLTIQVELRHAMPGARSSVWLALLDAHDRGELQLLEPGNA